MRFYSFYFPIVIVMSVAMKQTKDLANKQHPRTRRLLNRNNFLFIKMLLNNTCPKSNLILLPNKKLE